MLKKGLCLTVGLFPSYTESRLYQRDMHIYQERISAQKHTDQDRCSRLETEPQPKYQFLTSDYSGKTTSTQKVTYINPSTYNVSV